MAKYVLPVILILLMVGCGYQEGRIQQEEKSYLRFGGKWRNASVYFNDNPNPVHLKVFIPPVSQSETTSTEENYPPLTYAVRPGQYRLRIFKEEQLVVDRLLFLGDQATMEVYIP